MLNQKLSIRPLEKKDLAALRDFTDREIGAGYYTASELEEIFERSSKDGVMYTLVLESPAQIEGVRITYPPGQWQKGKGQGLSVDKWPHPLDKTAYFQSLFLSENLRGSGYGGVISQQAMALLKKHGARGVVCHSWKESPRGSSTRYLLKLGFVPIAEYPGYWKDVNYNCTVCLKPPCQCTAQEMYLDLEKIL